MKKGMVHAAATGALRLDQRNAIDTQWQQLLLLPLCEVPSWRMCVEGSGPLPCLLAAAHEIRQMLLGIFVLSFPLFVCVLYMIDRWYSAKRRKQEAEEEPLELLKSFHPAHARASESRQKSTLSLTPSCPASVSTRVRGSRREPDDGLLTARMGSTVVHMLTNPRGKLRSQPTQVAQAGCQSVQKSRLGVQEESGLTLAVAGEMDEPYGLDFPDPFEKSALNEFRGWLEDRTRTCSHEREPLGAIRESSCESDRFSS